MPAITDIAHQFSQSEAPLAISPLGNGLINDTFLVSSEDSQWVLQRINRHVFPNPQWLIDNLHQLTQHVQQKPATQVRLIIPAMLPTAEQQPCVVDSNGDYWRALAFVPHSYSKERLTGLTDAKQIGWALAHFHALSSDLAATVLHDTLPGFHITPHYLAHFQQTIKLEQSLPRDEAYHFCVAYIEAHQTLASVLEDAKLTGELTLRVMHGDPKVNNFLFDDRTGEVISLIDLDTVKPGLWHYDIGDCLRSCCHSTDDRFDLTVAEAILTSYLSEAKLFFKPADYAYLYAAIELIPFELGIRFFTDYLQGNCYFKVTDAQQNCQRAVQQFKLCDSIREQRDAIEHIIAKNTP